MKTLQSLAITCVAAALLCISSAQAQPTMSPLVAGILAQDMEAVRAALDAGALPNALDPELQRAPKDRKIIPGAILVRRAKAPGAGMQEVPDCA